MLLYFTVLIVIVVVTVADNDDVIVVVVSFMFLWLHLFPFDGKNYSIRPKTITINLYLSSVELSSISADEFKSHPHTTNSTL